MSTGDLISIEPQELQFPFELRKQISCSLQLTNKTDNYVAFKVKTTNPKKYCVRPNTGIVLPHSACDVIVTMQAQKEAPPDMQCKDKFLLQSAVASPGATTKDITAEMFNKESGNHVEECKLRVSYVPPPQPPSPVREGSEEGSSPRASVSDNGTINRAEYTAASSAYVERAYVEPQDNSSETPLQSLHHHTHLKIERHKSTFGMMGMGMEIPFRSTLYSILTLILFPLHFIPSYQTCSRDLMVAINSVVYTALIRPRVMRLTPLSITRIILSSFETFNLTFPITLFSLNMTKTMTLMSHDIEFLHAF
ncbi:hypothetical protein TEA_026346 [Camellia sinensis var. sinensis]|uniref:MSP domain-containing protein n=1 Tax=Camellia sinensis var. sinensis TaxID=542762 RepID=A0A4S4EI36_CAMSN|nr:hypothetical protein TEA_026346 [Camellia sinensis var. sinensis]